jgi:hypothetical protein
LLRERDILSPKANRKSKRAYRAKLEAELGKAKGKKEASTSKFFRYF